MNLPCWVWKGNVHPYGALIVFQSPCPVLNIYSTLKFTWRVRIFEKNDVEDKMGFCTRLWTIWSCHLHWRVSGLWKEAGEPEENSRRHTENKLQAKRPQSWKWPRHSRCQTLQHPITFNLLNTNTELNLSLMSIISSACHLEWHVYFHHATISESLHISTFPSSICQRWVEWNDGGSADPSGQINSCMCVCVCSAYYLFFVDMWHAANGSGLCDAPLLCVVVKSPAASLSLVSSFSLKVLDGRSTFQVVSKLDID